MAHLPLEDKFEYTKVFLKVDHEQGNGDGVLTLDEFEKMMIFCGHRMSRQDIGKAFINFDSDGNWKITLDEFLAILPKLTNFNSREYIAAKLRRVFEFYDTDKDGYVKLEDLRSAISKHSLAVDENELAELFSQCDVDADGQLNFEEFATIYVNKEEAKEIAKSAKEKEESMEKKEEKGK